MITDISRVPWFVSERPLLFDDWISPPSQKKQLVTSSLSDSPPHLLIAGPPGCGKTTAWRLFCRQVLGPSWEGTTHIYQAKDESKGKATDKFTEFLKPKDHGGLSLTGHMSLSAFDRTIVSTSKSPPPTGFERLNNQEGGENTLPISRIIVIEDADCLGSRIQPMLRGFMEHESRTTRFVMTCRAPSQLIEALRSRMLQIRLSSISKEKIVKRMLAILSSKGLSSNKDVLEDIAHFVNGDLRKAILILEIAEINDILNNRSKVQSILLGSSQHEGRRILHSALKGRTHAVDEYKTGKRTVPRVAGAMGLIDRWMYDYGLEPNEVLHRIHSAITSPGLMLGDNQIAAILYALAEADTKIRENIVPRAVFEYFLLECKKLGRKFGIALE